jgi:PhnB protein
MTDSAEQHHGMTPYLCVHDGAAAIEFYKRAFNATEVMRIVAPDGKIGHAELTSEYGTIMLSDEYPEMDVRSPRMIGGTPLTLHVYLPNVDEFSARFVAAGGKVVREVADQFYGDRGGKFEDPFGHMWWFSTRIESISADEMQRRAAETFRE